MEHIGTVTLETLRLILRRFDVHKDAVHAYENWCSDRGEFSKYLSWPPHKSVDETKEILRSWVDKYSKKDFYTWAIELKGLGQPIGSISVVAYDDETEMVEFGYCTGRKWWGKGITSEALARLIDFFFKEVGANRIQARYDTANPASGRVMEKCGMLHEGIMRQSYRNNSGICDLAVSSILKSDYFNIN